MEYNPDQIILYREHKSISIGEIEYVYDTWVEVKNTRVVFQLNRFYQSPRVGLDHIVRVVDRSYLDKTNKEIIYEFPELVLKII